VVTTKFLATKTLTTKKNCGDQKNLLAIEKFVETKALAMENLWQPKLWQQKILW
jgi:hypothetical protein